MINAWFSLKHDRHDVRSRFLAMLSSFPAVGLDDVRCSAHTISRTSLSTLSFAIHARHEISLNLGLQSLRSSALSNMPLRDAWPGSWHEHRTASGDSLPQAALDLSVAFVTIAKDDCINNFFLSLFRTPRYAKPRAPHSVFRFSSKLLQLLSTPTQCVRSKPSILVRPEEGTKSRT